MNEKLGSYIKSLRITQRITLKEFCIKNSFDTVLYSKWERNVLLPPYESLTSIADALNIIKDSYEWFELVSLHSKTKIQDSNNINKLPLLHVNHLSEEQLDALAKAINTF